ncbi:D-2-hydroxyacid dehydrogenase [Mesorhizobium sp. B2-4-14]|uniref:D-2-hydroxyacid dehydrogenase n=1 Tax=Mesorhizobium sp. B2-4-14 TaxID=2589935 RepID=UPI001127B27A|nr:D-2-hydroxyacid dehydrogenase [Mesorhizobium sp. B2-4-14]TPK99858.1 D-2-hydroxyacid dehydrogenase [Mesorhizobium sp. B2-4-14]
MTTKQFCIYVENKVGVAPTYEVTEAQIRHAIRVDTIRLDITVRRSDNLDSDRLKQADFFVGSGFDTAVIRRHGDNLRLVHCTSAGIEKYLPLDWLPPGAALTNSSGVHAEKGGTFGAMAVLMLNEGMPRHATNQRHHRWDSALSTGITGKTVLIYGFGSLGEAIAERLRPFGVYIVGVRRSGEPHPLADEMHPPGELRHLLPRVDFLVVSCPLTEATRSLFDEGLLSLLPKGSSLFNIARGPVVDNAALAAALRAGHLAGAIIDVFEHEPLPDTSPWWDVPNLLISPHISCDDAKGYIERCLAIFGANVERLCRGEALRNVVDSVQGY